MLSTSASLPVIIAGFISLVVISVSRSDVTFSLNCLRRETRDFSRHFYVNHLNLSFTKSSFTATTVNIIGVIKTTRHPPLVTILPTFMYIPLLDNGIPISLEICPLAADIPTSLLKENPHLFMIIFLSKI